MSFDTTRAGDIELRWAPREVHAIHAAGLRDLAEEYAQIGDRELARECEQLAASTEAALAVEREAGR